MKRILVITIVAVLASAAMAQVPQQQPQQNTGMAGGIQPNDAAQLNNLLLQLDQTSRTAMADLAKLRIDKWKTDVSNKQQMQANVDSLQRNLATALPELQNKVRLAPEDMAANFKLYRNLSAVYDVFASVAESAGAFGPKDQYEPLAQLAGDFDRVRRSIADRIEQLATAKDIELARLRNQARAAQQAQAAQPPKKIVVDDNEPTRKPRKKKPSAAPPS